MNELSDDVLRQIIRTDGKLRVLNLEDNKIEYKQTFDWEDKSFRLKCLKELAALGNSGGGYLIFGIDDKSGEITGIAEKTIVDTAKITDAFSSLFSPEIIFSARKYLLSDRLLFVLYVESKKDIPTICIKEFEGVRNGTILSRYGSKSEMMKGSELISIFHSILNNGHKAMAAIEEKKLSLDHKPRIEKGISGSDYGGIKIAFKNVGRRFKIESISSLTKGINASLHMKLPEWLENGASIATRVTSHSDLNVLNTEYELQILVTNEIDEEYSITVIGKGGAAKINEPVEI